MIQESVESVDLNINNFKLIKMNQKSLKTVDWNKNNFQTNQNEYGKFKFLKYHIGPKLIDVTKVYLVIGNHWNHRFHWLYRVYIS